MDATSRQRLSRRLLVWPLVFGVLGGIALTGWQRRQADLDAGLLAAICRDDAPAAVALLDRGADPNAALVVGRPDTPSDLLHGLLHRLRREPVVPRNVGVPALCLVYDPAITTFGGRGVRDSNRAAPARPLLTGWPLVRPHRLALARALLNKGANPNTGPYDTESPLNIAVRARDYDSVQLLLEHGANPNTGTRYLSTSPLLDADIRCAQLLLAHGANPNAAGRFAETVLMHAVSDDESWRRTHRAELVELLLRYGVDVNAGDRYNQTALMHAVNVAYARLLVDHGANVNARSRQGATALMMACATRGYHDAGLAAFLISRGADVSATDNLGRTARTYAIRYAVGKPDPHLLALLDAAEAAERRRMQPVPAPLQRGDR
ncbi:MAG TPA: ankyrin repeat domain-containing protein [Chthonomonadaceae bacterium]|nr:ankyrin repeat domain-containing protein [Chthonomonadaceae bacterium]